jgi:hypothetical protein
MLHNNQKNFTQKYKKVEIVQVKNGQNLRVFNNNFRRSFLEVALLKVIEPKLLLFLNEASKNSFIYENRHKALKKIKKSWKNIHWIILVDLTNSFSEASQTRLLKKLGWFYDQDTCRFIYKLLKLNYFQLSNGFFRQSLLNLLLLNFYFYEFDYSIQHLLNTKSFTDSSYYVRYSKDFVLGLGCSITKAKVFRTNIVRSLNHSLKLKVSVKNFKIKKCANNGFVFLGFFFKYSAVNFFSSGTVFKKNSSCFELYIPVRILLRSAIFLGYAKKKTGGIYSSFCKTLLVHNDTQIISHFGKILQSLVSYYLPADRFGDLQIILALYKKSCVLTLAKKHKIKSMVSVYNIYGLNFSNFTHFPIKKI